MSFGRQFTGTKSEIIAAVAGLAADVQAADEQWNAPQAIIDGHQQQATFGAQVITSLLETLPASDEPMTVTVSGHADTFGNGSVGIGVQYRTPPAASPAAATVTDPAPAESIAGDAPSA